ncbi:MAG: hypothetical protein V9H25_14215 [Candidatus Competibacter sp.]
MITTGPLGARSGCQVNSPGFRVAASRTSGTVAAGAVAAGCPVEWRAIGAVCGACSARRDFSGAE